MKGAAAVCTVLSTLGLANAAAYSGANFGSSGDNSNVCPTGYSDMNLAECQNVAAVIVTANAATTEYSELQSLMRAAASGATGANSFVFGTTALGTSTIVGNAAINSATEPTGCHMDADISTPTTNAATNGNMFYNTNAGTAKADKPKVCKINRCSCSNGVGATGAACPTNGAAKCSSCNAGYLLSGTSCVPPSPPPPPPSPLFPPFPPGEAPCDFCECNQSL